MMNVLNACLNLFIATEARLLKKALKATKTKGAECMRSSLGSALTFLWDTFILFIYFNSRTSTEERSVFLPFKESSQRLIFEYFFVPTLHFKSECRGVTWFFAAGHPALIPSDGLLQEIGSGLLWPAGGGGPVHAELSVL